MAKRSIAVSILLITAFLLFELPTYAQNGCNPVSNYSLNDMGVSSVLLLPSQVQSVTATINVAGGHNIVVSLTRGKRTYTTTLNWSSTNGISASGYYTLNGGSHNSWNASLNGSQQISFSSSAIGDYVYYFVVTDSNGRTSSDRVNIIVTIDPFGINYGITSNDELATNYYLHTMSTLGGYATMALENCNLCIIYPQMCQNVMHTPSMSLSVNNVQTGESHSIPLTAGQPVCANCNIDQSVLDDISVLPGDEVDASTDGQVECPLAGNFFNTGGGTVRRIVKTKVYSEFPAPPAWSVIPWCTSDTNPPSWAPLTVEGDIPWNYLWAGTYAWSSPKDPGWNFPQIFPVIAVGTLNSSLGKCTILPPAPY